MITLRNRTVLMVAAFMLSAMQSFANETCAANVNECTPVQLCEASTSIVNGQKVWSADPAYADHVSTSQQLGINCGVVEVVQPTCETDANLCTVTALCEQATQISASGSTKTWSADNAAHARLARQFGLTCGVGETVAAEPSVAVDDEALCTRTTFVVGSAIRWRGIPLRREAEERGLTCNVGMRVGDQAILGSPSASNDAQVCTRATHDYQGRVVWLGTARSAPWRSEAEERGLTCGIVENSGAQANHISDAELCSRATFVHSGGNNRITWRGGLLRRQAEERGLTCGVGETAAAQPGVALDDEALCARATFVYDERITWRGGLLRRQAEERGLTCGVGEAVVAQSAPVTVERLCPSSGSYFHECYGPWTDKDGTTFIGSWSDGSLTGVGTAIFGSGWQRGSVKIGMTIDGYIGGGEAIFIRPDGRVRYDQNWSRGQNLESNSDINNVFPYLTQMFQALPREKRLLVQRSLSRKGLYSSTIDGVWGRNTFIGIARFAGEYVGSVNLTPSENVTLVLEAIIAQANLVRTERATSSVTQRLVRRVEVVPVASFNAADFRQVFVSRTLLQRQQLQYALKELGHYSSSIDGLWGNGTSSAMARFVQSTGVNARYPERVFRDLLSRVDVPSSFAAPRTSTPRAATASSTTQSASPEARVEQICRRRADQARRVARNNHRPSNTSTTATCRRDFFGNYDCSTSTGVTGGAWGGMLAALEADNAGRDAYDLEYETCMIQLGN
jgi:hypothetical protein